MGVVVVPEREKGTNCWLEDILRDQAFVRYLGERLMKWKGGFFRKRNEKEVKVHDKGVVRVLS